MREGIYWRGRHRQQECNPNQDRLQGMMLREGIGGPPLREIFEKLLQSFVLPLGRQARRRGVKVVTLCLILCFLTWATSRFWTASGPISIESLSHQAPMRAIVVELFRYNRHPRLVRNRTFIGVTPVHQRRRGLLEDSETTTLTAQEICDDNESSDGQVVDDNHEYVSCTKRKGRENHDKLMKIQIKGDYGNDNDNTRAPLERWPVHGGERESDLDIYSFFIKVALGYGTAMKEYFLSIDTGSGITWVNCEGRGPIRDMGPNGVFVPTADRYLHCEKKPKVCMDFQEGNMHPCDKAHKYRCLFEYEYADNTLVEGYVVEGDVRFDLSNGSRVQMSIPFGCADRVKDSATSDEDTVEEEELTDGLLGLGPHQPAGWLQQLFYLGLISEFRFAICLEPRLGDIDIPLPDPSLVNYAGFLAFGELFATQAANTVWTRIIPPKSDIAKENDPMYTAKLLGYKYRKQVVYLKESVDRRAGPFAVEGVEMGFDTGCDLTWFTPEVFSRISHTLDQDAKRMGYEETPDSDDYSEQRKCWIKRSSGLALWSSCIFDLFKTQGTSERSSVRDFANLVLIFSSPAGGGKTSDFVIEPQYFITTTDVGDHQRKCFNIRSEAEWDYGNLGGEVMRGHLIIFDERHSRIGWRSVTSCAKKL